MRVRKKLPFEQYCTVVAKGHAHEGNTSAQGRRTPWVLGRVLVEARAAAPNRGRLMGRRRLA